MRQIGSIRYDFKKCTFGGGGLCVSAPEIALFALSLRAEDGTQTKLNGQNAAFEGLDERGGTLTAHYSFECGVHVRLHIACSGERTAFRLDADVPADRKLEWAEYAPVCVPPLLERDGEGGRAQCAGCSLRLPAKTNRFWDANRPRQTAFWICCAFQTTALN